MIISIRGIGWITSKEYGCARTGVRQGFAAAGGNAALLNKAILTSPVKNFGRFDRVSKMTCYSIGLALRDAGIEYSSTRKQDIGIIGTNAEGSLRSDIEYFRDYLAGGRKLSRGNLFIYTLPSSPLGEAAIHFGLLGPLLYVTGTDTVLTMALDAAKEMLLAREAPIMLAGRADDDEAVYFVLGAGPGADTASFLGFAEARNLAETCSDAAELAHNYQLAYAGKG
jgi:3-oxoacyl-[acyl-carrier-protein] synthase II